MIADRCLLKYKSKSLSPSAKILPSSVLDLVKVVSIKEYYNLGFPRTSLIPILNDFARLISGGDCYSKLEKLEIEIRDTDFGLNAIVNDEQAFVDSKNDVHIKALLKSWLPTPGHSSYLPVQRADGKVVQLSLRVVDIRGESHSGVVPGTCIPQQTTYTTEMSCGFRVNSFDSVVIVERKVRHTENTINFDDWKQHIAGKPLIAEQANYQVG